MGSQSAGGLRRVWLRLQRWGLERLEAMAVSRRSLVGAAPGPAHLATGLRGEREALFHLRELGYVVVARRWQTVRLRGDVDLIAWEGDRLCFIEVKTRTGHNPMEPAESAVDEGKKERLRRMARVYLRSFPRGLREEVHVRFDVVSVYLQASGTGRRKPGRKSPEFDVHRGAFSWN